MVWIWRGGEVRRSGGGVTTISKYCIRKKVFSIKVEKRVFFLKLKFTEGMFLLRFFLL